MKYLKIADEAFCRQLYELLGLDIDGIRSIKRVRIIVEPQCAVEVEETLHIVDNGQQSWGRNTNASNTRTRQKASLSSGGIARMRR